MKNRQLVFVCLCVVALLGAAVAHRLFSLRRLPPGVTTLTSIDAEVFIVDASPIVKRGSNSVLVMRFRGDVEFEPHQYRESGLDEPATADHWAQHLSAPVVFNAGQFDENQSYLGWLKSNGRWLSHRRKDVWKGLLVSGPQALEGKSGAWATILDLETANLSDVDGYKHAVQSMMLIDAHGHVRVRESEKSACRTVVAEDVSGRLLLLVTQGAVTLADMARWLSTTDLEIVRAMNLDGGFESQVAINTSEVQMTFFGQYGTNSSMLPGFLGLVRKPLPIAIGVFPKERLRRSANRLTSVSD